MPATHPFPLGLQLFGVHTAMNQDPVGTLRAVRAMGYRHLEVYGYDPDENTIYGMPCAAFQTVLNDLGLAATSGHFGFHHYLDGPAEAMNRFTDRCIAAAYALQIPYVTWPWLAPDQRTAATFARLPDLLNRIGEQVDAAGRGFAYHNNDFEFVTYRFDGNKIGGSGAGGGDGTTGYDRLLAETDPELVKFQLDMYWVLRGEKTTPRELIARQPGRYVMWHLKDMHKVSRDYTELGNGSIDYTQVLPDPVTSGLEYFYLEQGGNFTYNPLRSAEDSADFFRQHLRHLIV